MAHNSLTYQLTRTDLFRGLTPFQITEIARNSERVMFQPGDTISACGAQSDRAILVIEGEVTCTEGAGAEETFDGDQAGLMIGEMAMFIDDFEHPSTFLARSPTKALMIGRTAMLDQMANDAEMAEYLVAKMAERLDRLVEQLRHIEIQLSDASDADDGLRLGGDVTRSRLADIPAAPVVH